MTTITEAAPAQGWVEANHRFLLGELERLRVILQRHVLWLRQRWHTDPMEPYRGVLVSDAQADALLAGPSREAELEFYRSDPAAAALGHSLAALEARRESRVAALSAAGIPPAVEILTRHFELTVFEREVLLLCLAPELDPGFETLFAYVQDDARRRLPAAALTLVLFGGDGEEWQIARESFLPDAPLRRYRMVGIDGDGPDLVSRGSRPLLLDERVADYLLGANRLDERASALLRPIALGHLSTEEAVQVERTRAWIEDRLNDGRWPILNLVGPANAGGETLAAAICKEMGLQLMSLDLARVGQAALEPAVLGLLLEREAALLRLAVYVDAIQVDSSADTTSTLRDLVAPAGALFVVATGAPWHTSNDVLTVPLVRPSTEVQRTLWLESLAGVPHSLNGRLDTMVRHFDLEAAAIRQVVGAAQSKARLRAGAAEPVSDADLWQSCRERGRRLMEGLAERISPRCAWEDLVLPEDVVAQLRELAAQVAFRQQVYEEWGFGARLSRGRGISALFSGPSGTGKTLAAEVLAQHLDLDLYRIDLASIVSKYIGETEKNLKRVFDAAEQGGSILFFDEADALFGKRSEVKDSHDRYANIEIDYLLQRMEEYRGLAVLATNMKSLLDPAFLRRLRFLVDFPHPTPVLRRRIWERVFPPPAAVGQLDFGLLARLDITGANIRNIALNAAFQAAAAGEPIGMENVLHAVRREYAKIERVTLENELGVRYAGARQ